MMKAVAEPDREPVGNRVQLSAQISSAGAYGAAPVRPVSRKLETAARQAGGWKVASGRLDVPPSLRILSQTVPASEDGPRHPRT
jgi:hypothetical protein